MTSADTTSITDLLVRATRGSVWVRAPRNTTGKWPDSMLPCQSIFAPRDENEVVALGGKVSGKSFAYAR